VPIVRNWVRFCIFQGPHFCNSVLREGLYIISFCTIQHRFGVVFGHPSGAGISRLRPSMGFQQAKACFDLGLTPSMGFQDRVFLSQFGVRLIIEHFPGTCSARGAEKCRNRKGFDTQKRVSVSGCRPRRFSRLRFPFIIRGKADNRAFVGALFCRKSFLFTQVP